MSNVENSDGGKPWYASKTIWGGLLAVLAPASALIFRQNFDPAFVDAVAAALAAIGGAIAVFGRVKAETAIK